MTVAYLRTVIILQESSFKKINDHVGNVWRSICNRGVMACAREVSGPGKFLLQAFHFEKLVDRPTRTVVVSVHFTPYFVSE